MGEQDSGQHNRTTAWRSVSLVSVPLVSVAAVSSLTLTGCTGLASYPSDPLAAEQLAPLLPADVAHDAGFELAEDEIMGPGQAPLTLEEHRDNLQYTVEYWEEEHGIAVERAESDSSYRECAEETGEFADLYRDYASDAGDRFPAEGTVEESWADAVYKAEDDTTLEVHLFSSAPDLLGEAEGINEAWVEQMRVCRPLEIEEGYGSTVTDTAPLALGQVHGYEISGQDEEDSGAEILAVTQMGSVYIEVEASGPREAEELAGLIEEMLDEIEDGLADY